MDSLLHPSLKKKEAPSVRLIWQFFTGLLRFSLAINLIDLIDFKLFFLKLSLLVFFLDYSFITQ